MTEHSRHLQRGEHLLDLRRDAEAEQAFRDVLTDDPEYTGRDAVYFHLAESYVKIKQQAQALPYYERLVQEFEQSEHLVDARKRIVEIKAGQTPKL